MGRSVVKSEKYNYGGLTRNRSSDDQPLYLHKSTLLAVLLIFLLFTQELEGTTGHPQNHGTVTDANHQYDAAERLLMMDPPRGQKGGSRLLVAIVDWQLTPSHLVRCFRSAGLSLVPPT